MQNILVLLIVAAAAGWLIWKFTRKKAGACGSCECSHSPDKEQTEIAAPTERKR